MSGDGCGSVGAVGLGPGADARGRRCTRVREGTQPGQAALTRTNRPSPPRGRDRLARQRLRPGARGVSRAWRLRCRSAAGERAGSSPRRVAAPTRSPDGAAGRDLAQSSPRSSAPRPASIGAALVGVRGARRGAVVARCPLPSAPRRSGTSPTSRSACSTELRRLPTPSSARTPAGRAASSQRHGIEGPAPLSYHRHNEASARTTCWIGSGVVNGSRWSPTQACPA